MGLLDLLGVSIRFTESEEIQENETDSDTTSEDKIASRRMAMEQAREQHDAINKLRALAYKVVDDGVITLDEALEIKRVFKNDEFLRNDEVMRPVYLMVRKVTKKSSTEDVDQETLINALHRIIDPTWVTDGEILDEINGKTFCLTGDFLFGTRKQVQDHLVSLGGIAKSGVSKSLDYLIVGTDGSEEYAYGNYGSKVKKAMELQNSGCTIKIVPEREFEPLR